MDQYFIVSVDMGELPEEEINAYAREQYQCQGIEEFSLDEATVDQILGERSYSGADIPVEVIQEVEATTKGNNAINKYYFSEQNMACDFSDFLNKRFNIKPQLDTLEEKDWNEEWRKNFQRIVISESLEVVPSWERDENKKTQKELYIYPGQGFGTGNHETTYLCLKLYSECVEKGAGFTNCLDFGCGSGILGLAYARDFTGHVDMYDIDQAALDNCQQNIEINTLKSDKINLLLPDQRKVIEWQTYSLIFANILQNVLLLEKEYLTSHLASDGFLILSGLLNGQEQLVIEEYQKANPHLQLVAIERKGDWVAVLMQLQ
ncbi:MAG: hypothetical protein CME62_02860 [Halobacteriovoraceae bacterium]|nr:hypothetical protein [Halobacteriovoraceae bacterium]|tara:strand:- start:22281 stop:23237 length:957 start_codon:yes stop_codon:yes gene_type:complete